MSFLDRVDFFRKHGCSRVGHEDEDAKALAEAEVWAEDNDVKFVWEVDEYADREPEEGNETLGVRVMHQSKCLASCGGIELKSPSFICGVPQDSYIRVVQARLAGEAKFTLDFQTEVRKTAEAVDFGEATANCFNAALALREKYPWPQALDEIRFVMIRAFSDALSEKFKTFKENKP